MSAVETAVEETVRGALFLRYVYAEVTIPMFGKHVKGRALALRDGLTSGAKDMFSNVKIPRPENIADEFDRLAQSGGAVAAYAALNAAKEVGSALNVLETAFKSVAESSYNKTSATAESLSALKARADAYLFGSDISEMLRRDREAPQEVMYRTIAQRKQIDWEYLLENFPYVPANTTAVYVTNTQETVREISLVRAVAIYLSTTSDAYCPLFGQGLFHTLSRPLLSKCDMDNQIYSRDSTQTERMERFDDALWATLFAALAVFAAQSYLGLPVLTVLMPFAVTLFWYMWMYIAYGFSYNCMPSLPVMLFADISAFINRWHPEPLCMRFSALAVTCDPRADLSFNNETQWRDCFEDEAVSQLGYMYSLVYYVRDLVPEVYVYLRTVQPFRYWLSGFKVLDLLEDTSVPLRENCARLLLLDSFGVIALAGTVVWMTFSLVVPPVVAVLRAAVQLVLQLSGLANLMVLSVTKVELND